MSAITDAVEDIERAAFVIRKAGLLEVAEVCEVQATVARLEDCVSRAPDGFREQLVDVLKGILEKRKVATQPSVHP